MPTMADITVKKADGTTDIVWTALSPSAGDKVPAMWRSQTVGSAVAFRPEFREWSYSTPNGAQRVFKTSMVYPVTEVVDGVTKITGYCTQVTETKIAVISPDTTTSEACNQGINLLAASLTRAGMVSGFAPT